MKMPARKWMNVLLVLFFSQAACNLPLVVRTQPAANDNKTPIVPSVVASPTLTEPLFAASLTPQLHLQASQTSVPVPTALPAFTQTPLPSTVAPIALSDDLFTSVVLSAQVFFLACDPRVVHITVTPAQSGVYSVVFFYRIQYKVSGERTNWNEGFAMKSQSGNFGYDLQAANLKNFNKFKEPVAWVHYQLVSTDAHGNILGRSQVFRDQLTISDICP